MNIFRLIIPVIFICSFLSFKIAYTDELIIPPKKPDLNINKKETSNLKSEILPLKKPKEDIDVVKKDNIKKKKIDLGIILPKNKPLILVKDKKVVDKKKIIKSKFYSKKDFEIAKKAIDLIEKRKWETAIKLSLKAKDK